MYQVVRLEGGNEITRLAETHTGSLKVEALFSEVVDSRFKRLVDVQESKQGDGIGQGLQVPGGGK